MVSEIISENITVIDEQNLKNLFTFLENIGVRRNAICQQMQIGKNVIQKKETDKTIYTDIAFTSKLIEAVDEIIKDSDLKINPYYVMGESDEILYHNYAENFSYFFTGQDPLIKIGENIVFKIPILKIIIKDFEYFKRLLLFLQSNDKDKLTEKNYENKCYKSEFIIYNNEQSELVKEKFQKAQDDLKTIKQNNVDLEKEINDLIKKEKRLDREIHFSELYKNVRRDKSGNVYYDNEKIISRDNKMNLHLKRK